MYKQEALDSLECFRSNTAHILGDNDEKVKTIETCMMLVQEAEETEKWIPVSERLPEEGIYLVTFSSGQVGESSWHKGTRYNNGFDNYMNGITEDGKIFQYGVIAWMPLPKPYKEDDK